MEKLFFSNVDLKLYECNSQSLEVESCLKIVGQVLNSQIFFDSSDIIRSLEISQHKLQCGGLSFFKTYLIVRSYNFLENCDESEMNQLLVI